MRFQVLLLDTHNGRSRKPWITAKDEDTAKEQALKENQPNFKFVAIIGRKED
jgi:hypothetical protein